MMDSTDPSPDAAVRRRAAKACQFCRRRKMKCDNVEPKCTNCKTYGKECNYVELPKSSRPSKSRLSNLEEENRRLQERLQSVQPLNPSPQTTIGSTASADPSPPSALEPQTQIPFPNGPEQNNSALRNPGSSQSNYYGRTSALFDDDSADRPPALSGASRAVKGGPSERTEMQLMGEAAKQRQMEMINYNAGKLDFDGVDPELGMHLLSVHWNRQHHSHLITYRPAFMRDMACEGPYFSKLLLNAIYFGASKFSPRAELRNGPDSVRSAGQQFRQRVRDLLGGALDRSEITTIQALLIMTSSLFALGDERSAAWLYAGTAFRMIIDLGLHVDDLTPQAAQRLSEEDFEIRRRVFWGAFVVDKIQSLYQGRPMSLQEADTRVSILFQDRFEELEHWMPTAYVGTKDYRGSPAYSVSTFTELCKLSVFMNDILNSVYAEKSSKRGPVRLAEDLKRIQASLEEWEASLPLHLMLDSVESTTCPPPHVLSLQAMYNVLLILLHRPFVSEGHLHSTSPSIPANSFIVCSQAATKIVRILRVYDQTFSIQHAPYLISYATYVSATIHVRIAAQKGPGSEAHTSLATCLSVFDKNQETNWAVRRAKSVILNLMSRMKVALPEFNAVQSQNRRPEKQQNPASPRSAKLVQSSVPSPVVRSPELDIDQIIQSFIYEQQGSYGNISDQYRFQGATTETDPNAGAISVAGAVSQNLQPMSYDMGYNESPWSMENQLSGSAEDMLFGFNGSGVDYLW